MQKKGVLETIINTNATKLNTEIKENNQFRIRYIDLFI